MNYANQVNKDFPEVPEIVRTASGRKWSEPSTGHWQTDSGKVYVQNNQLLTSGRRQTSEECEKKGRLLAQMKMAVSQAETQRQGPCLRGLVLGPETYPRKSCWICPSQLENSWMHDFLVASISTLAELEPLSLSPYVHCTLGADKQFV